MTLLLNIFREIINVFLEMSPYLLLGFILAGILKISIPRKLLYRHLSGNGFFSIIKASLLGVPLPICSCGVIPLAEHLRKEKANKGAIISFLTSTPTTGVDSIFVTYALMGPVFAIIRPVMALVSGIFAGIMDHIIAYKDATIKEVNDQFSCIICDDENIHTHTILEKIKYVMHYAFIELVEDLGKWIAIGVILSGIISGLIPASLIGSYFSNPVVSYLTMIVIGVPLYVCSTGSIPIAASLLKVGISPGAALIFLMVGPATNAATISFVGGKFGRKSLFVYLSSIILVALISGVLFDNFFDSNEITMSITHIHNDFLPSTVKALSAVFLALLLANILRKKYFLKKTHGCCGSSHDHQHSHNEHEHKSCCRKKN